MLWPDLSMENYAQILEEDEARVQAHPCCLNCQNCLEEYGYHECKKDMMQEEYALNDQFCKEWRSCVTGAKWKGETR